MSSRRNFIKNSSKIGIGSYLLSGLEFPIYSKTRKSVSANELVMTVQPETSVNDDFSVNSIQVNQQSDGEQYAVLVVIIVAAIGAAIFYLKGYKRNR